jgi:hypothetical protein
VSVKTEFPENKLYLAVLPMVHLGETFGRTEQMLTLFPSREFATEFFPDEVEAYILTFERRANEYLVGGHVKSYAFAKERTKDGRVVVRVMQRVE